SQWFRITSACDHRIRRYGRCLPIAPALHGPRDGHRGSTFGRGCKRQSNGGVAAFQTSTSDSRENSSLDASTHLSEGDYGQETDPCTNRADNEIAGAREPARIHQLNELPCACTDGEHHAAR